MTDRQDDLNALLRRLIDGQPLDRAGALGMLGEEETADLLVDLAGRVSALRQRSAELRAVMSSTRDLLATQDTDQLLERIVTRAHDLMDVDVTYLSVYDPESDELYVRAQSGVISPEFATMVVPAGAGLASLIAHTGTPQTADDYRDLGDLPRDAIIDRIVDEEGLRSLVGAPLMVDDVVLGVLFAATRSDHVFRPDEIALLSTFAGHAALVLHVARLLDAATVASEDAARRQREAEWAAALHAELTELVVRGHTAGEVLGALATALGRDVALVDATGTHVAGSSLAVGPETQAAITAGIESARARRLTGAVELVATVPTGAATPGALLVARGSDVLTEVEQRTIERSGHILALLSLRHDAVADAEERVRGELALDLVGSEATRRSALRRAGGRGLPIENAWCCVIIPAEDDGRSALMRVVQGCASVPLVCAVSDAVVAFVPGADALAAADLVARALPAAHGRAIVAHAHADLEAAASEAGQTRRIAVLAQGLGAVGSVDAVALAPYATLFDVDTARLQSFVTTMIGAVLEWDGPASTVLFDTLLALQSERWSQAQAARRLHVHLSTLKQRQSRLRSLLGPELDDPEARFRIELAVRVEAARRRLPTAMI